MSDDELVGEYFGDLFSPFFPFNSLDRDQALLDEGKEHLRQFLFLGEDHELLRAHHFFEDLWIHDHNIRHVENIANKNIS